MVLEKTLESLLDCKEIKLVNPKGNQSWIFIGRTDVEAETPILWPPDAKNWLIWKDPDAGKDWRQEEKEMTEDEMVGWHHQLNGHEFEQAPGAGDGQGGLTCCSPWGHRVRHDWATELNWKLHTCNFISVFLAMLGLYCCISFLLLLFSCSVWASHGGGLACCRAQAQQLRCMGLVALWHVGIFLD